MKKFLETLLLDGYKKVGGRDQKYPLVYINKEHRNSHKRLHKKLRDSIGPILDTALTHVNAETLSYHKLKDGGFYNILTPRLKRQVTEVVFGD